MPASGPELLAVASRQPQPSILRLPIDFPLFLSQTRLSFTLDLSFFPSDSPSGLLQGNHHQTRPPPEFVFKMASPTHRYDDSDSDGGNFNPAPADLSDDEQQPTSPAESRNGARRSSQSRDDNEADGEANGDSHSVNEREDNDSENEDHAPARKAPRDDDDDEEDEDEDEDDDDEDEEDMPVREMAPAPLCSLTAWPLPPIPCLPLGAAIR